MAAAAVSVVDASVLDGTVISSDRLSKSRVVRTRVSIFCIFMTSFKKLFKRRIGNDLSVVAFGIPHISKTGMEVERKWVVVQSIIHAIIL